MRPDLFLSKLQDSRYNIPIEANFIITIPSLNTIASKLYRLNTKDNNLKNLFLDTNIVADVNSNNEKELFFATSVSIPGERVNTSRVGYTVDNTLYGGMLSTPVLKGRQDPSSLEINFIETNISFLDYFIRPWAVAASQYGLFARNKDNIQNLKTNLFVNFFDKKISTDGWTPKIRKTLIFNDVVPVEVGGYEAAYGKSTGVRTTKTTWTYSTYEVS